MLKVRELVVPVDEPTGAEAAARALIQAQSERHRYSEGVRAGSLGPPAMWLGADDALAELGLKPELPASLDRVALTIQGRHVKSRELVRRPGLSARPSVAAVDGNRTPPDERLVVVQFALTLPVPPRVTDRLRESEPELQAMIEWALLRSAGKAIGHMVLDRRVARSRWRLGLEAPVGFAAVAAVHGVSREEQEGRTTIMRPTVRAVLLGVQRVDKKLVVPHSREMRRWDARDEAQRVAWRALTDEPSLRYSGRQAVAAVRAFVRPPTLDESAPRQRPAVQGRDPVEKWRKRVGDRRAERIGALADDLEERMEELPYAELVTRRRAIGAEFTARDRVAARRALSLERDLDKLEEAVSSARRDAATLKADAARVRGGLGRAHILQAVEAIESRIAVDEIVRDRLLSTDRRRAARDRLDTWMTENAEKVADMVAIDRHLLARLYRRIEGEVDHARDNPPDYVRNAIGPAPEATAPEHNKWVAATTKLVYDHYVEVANRALGYQLLPRIPREQRTLEAQVRNLGVQRGLESAANQRTIESRSLGPDIAA